MGTFSKRNGPRRRAARERRERARQRREASSSSRGFVMDPPLREESESSGALQIALLLFTLVCVGFMVGLAVYSSGPW